VQNTYNNIEAKVFTSSGVGNGDVDFLDNNNISSSLALAQRASVLIHSVSVFTGLLAGLDAALGLDSVVALFGRPETTASVTAQIVPLESVRAVQCAGWFVLAPSINTWFTFTLLTTQFIHEEAVWAVHIAEILWTFILVFILIFFLCISPSIIIIAITSFRPDAFTYIAIIRTFLKPVLASHPTHRLQAAIYGFWYVTHTDITAISTFPETVLAIHHTHGSQTTVNSLRLIALTYITAISILLKTITTIHRTHRSHPTINLFRFIALTDITTISILLKTVVTIHRTHGSHPAIHLLRIIALTYITPIVTLLETLPAEHSTLWSQTAINFTGYNTLTNVTTI